MNSKTVDLIYSAIFYDLGDFLKALDLGQGEADTLALDFFDRHLGKDHLLRPFLTEDEDWSSCRDCIREADRLVRLMNGKSEPVETSHSAGGYPYLETIFTHFKDQEARTYIRPKVLTDGLAGVWQSVPSSKGEASDYSQILEGLSSGLETLGLTEQALPSWLLLLESLFSTVPSPSDQIPLDISYYEHIRLRVALAVCLLKNKESQVSESEKAYLMVTFDLSGIQDFIYHIVSKGALKQLKARSLYLEMMSEAIVDGLLEQEGLSRFNLIYNGGGHAYLLLPNRPDTVERLGQYEQAFNRFLLDVFKTRLFVAFAYQDFSEEVFGGDKASSSYVALHQALSRKLSAKKLSRYTAEELIALNNDPHNPERECLICHVTQGVSHKDNLCQLCHRLAEFSKKITYPYFYISDDDSGLPIAPKRYLKACDNLEEVSGRLYLKNTYAIDRAPGIPIFVGDYAYDTIDTYAESSVQEINGQRQGIKRLAVVRLDVDDLGAAFMAGFSSQDKGRYNNLSRSASFSRHLSRFYKFYINELAKDLKLSIVYSGGDDVFAIGSWQDIISFTLKIREAFVAWTKGKLTLSAGIGLFPDKTPISLMAKLTGELEEAAKENDKDSICLFTSDYTFKFDDYRTKVCDEKLALITSFFENQNDRGKVFLYKLLELLQNDDKMNIARLAYYLSKLEDVTTKQHLGLFREFKETFFDWYRSDAQTRKEVEFALILYSYYTRKD